MWYGGEGDKRVIGDDEQKIQFHEFFLERLFFHIHFKIQFS